MILIHKSEEQRLQKIVLWKNWNVKLLIFSYILEAFISNPQSIFKINQTNFPEKCFFGFYISWFISKTCWVRDLGILESYCFISVYPLSIIEISSGTFLPYLHLFSLFLFYFLLKKASISIKLSTHEKANAEILSFLLLQ